MFWKQFKRNSTFRYGFILCAILIVYLVYKFFFLSIAFEDIADQGKKIPSNSDGIPPNTKVIHNVPSSKSQLEEDIEWADILLVGAGLSGAVLAHLHAVLLNKKCLVIDKRDHLGGNIFDFKNEVGIRVSKYGAHLFHTKHERVWRYVQQFTAWTPYDHRVIGRVDGLIVPIPVNIDTVNLLMNESIHSTDEMTKWMLHNQIHNANPVNGEEAAQARVGKVLYEKIFKNYTYKQWAKYPNELDAAVLQRIPVRLNYDDRYFPDDPYQALPSDGYTKFAENMLTHENIRSHINTNYFTLLKQKMISSNTFQRIFFTGPIDEYFSSVGLEKLEYRSINFETKHLKQAYFQSSSVVNYPQDPEKFTRIVEYKHLYCQESDHTTIVTEYTSDHGDPYYPVPNQRNRDLYNKYKTMAEDEEKSRNVSFVGRLASYKYFNMDDAILNAIQEFERVYSSMNINMEPMYGGIGTYEAGKLFRKTPNFSVSFIISYCTENLTWLTFVLKELCEKKDIHIFIYPRCNTVPKISSKLSKCKVSIANDVGYKMQHSKAWVDHLFLKSCCFSDVNIFVRANTKVKIETITKILNEGINGVKDFKAKEQVQNDIRKTGHWMDLFPSQCSIRPDPMLCKKALPNSDKCDRFSSSRSGEWVATEAGLRRMLSRHRTLLKAMLENSLTNLDTLWPVLFLEEYNKIC